MPKVGKSGSKRPPGRPIEKEMPPLIPDTPFNVAFAVLNTPPKKEKDWEYLRDDKR